MSQQLATEELERSNAPDASQILSEDDWVCCGAFDALVEMDECSAELESGVAQ